ncbi:MAG: hypothetical protein JEY97_15070 [Bacteroidales bacterium]|nr:hypothetical protein [Bacteroidales bacterium]
MKKQNLLYIIGIIVLNLFSCENVFSQKISRGPDIGEIYFLGLSKSGLNATIYRSTDFGETIECMDSITQNTYWIESIEADKTSGVLYFVSAYGGLHYSNNFGKSGSWVFRQNDISWNICSGLVEGQIYNTYHSHSNNYGINFMTHLANGFFGGLKYCEIDNLQDIGYVIVNKWGVSDSIYFLKTTDNFDNLILDTVLNFGYSDNIILSRALEEGELFMFNSSNEPSNLLYSSDFAQNWIETNNFNFEIFYHFDMVGGRQEGEVYLMYEIVNMMWQNAHTYIFHSTDYGVTFEVFHPFA